MIWNKQAMLEHPMDQQETLIRKFGTSYR